VKFKLDENIGKRGLELLRTAGHDVETVCEEGLGGESDDVIFNSVVKEGRALITLDHDFCHVLRFPPETSHGIVILELPPQALPDSINLRLKDFLAILSTRPLKNELWIVEPFRIRIHQTEKEG